MLSNHYHGPAAEKPRPARAGLGARLDDGVRLVGRRRCRTLCSRRAWVG